MLNKITKEQQIYNNITKANLAATTGSFKIYKKTVPLNIKKKRIILDDIKKKNKNKIMNRFI